MKAPLPGVIGRYQVRDRLAEGGMGVLYLAVDPIIDRLVAIKLMRVGHDSELAERFAREARAAGRLLHPNIITIFDVGDHEGQPFIAMEYVTGETLGELVKRRAQLPLARKVRLIADLCDGLSFAHRSGIVHRDIKPANIMVTREGILKILDFGIAHLADSRMTQTGAFMGTPAYMSPEQISGNVIDHRSDIFAVGAVLYELLAYRQAFEGDSPIRITHRILTEQPTPLLEIDPSLNRALVDIVRRAIEKEPSSRYADLTAMRADLLKVSDRDDAASETTVAVEPRRPAVSGPPTPDRKSHARRRAAQIESHLSAAREALAAGRFEDAISASDQAAVLDPDDNRAHDLIAQAREAIQKQQARELLVQAREAMKRGAVTDAADLLAQTLAALPGDSQALALQREIRALQRERELLAERKRLIQRALDHARSSLKERALDSAVRSANEVLAQDPQNEEAGVIKEEALEILAAEREKAELDRRARDAMSAARVVFDAGRRDIAIADLERFRPSHELVDRLLAELRREAVGIREREEARRAAEAEAARAAARRAAEAKAAEEAREAARRAAEARAAEEAREAARRAAEARAAEEAREAARRAAEARAAEEARGAARRAAEARAAEEARETARRAAEAREAERQAAQAREAQRRAAEARERERLAAEAHAAEETRLADPAPRSDETMLDTGGGWHRAGGAREAAAPARPASPRYEARPDVAQHTADLPDRSPLPRWKYVALAGTLVAAALVIAVVLRPGTNTEIDRATPTAPTVATPTPPSTGVTPLTRSSVTINAVPWATVRIVPKDSSQAASNGVTPFVVDLPEGDYTLEFRNELFAPLTQPLTVRRGEPGAVTVTMPGADLERIVNDVLGPAQ